MFMAYCHMTRPSLQPYSVEMRDLGNHGFANVTCNNFLFFFFFFFLCVSGVYFLSSVSLSTGNRGLVSQLADFV